MEEEEEDEEQCDDEVGCFEEFVVPIPIQLASSNHHSRIDVPDRGQRHDRQISLWNKRRNTSPVCQARIPLHNHIAFVDVIHDEREGVNQSEDEHSITGPLMKHLKLLMRNSSQRRDQVRFGSERPITSQHMPHTPYHRTYKTKGNIAKAIHPVLVARGGLLP